MNKIKRKKTDDLITAFFNSEKGKELLWRNEKELEEEFRTKTGCFSPEEDKAWSYLKKEI